MSYDFFLKKINKFIANENSWIFVRDRSENNYSKLSRHVENSVYTFLKIKPYQNIANMCFVFCVLWSFL